MMKINTIVPNEWHKRIFSFLVVAAMLVSFGCRSKTVVKKLSNVNSKTETKTIKGALYHLPLTVIKVTVPLKMTKKKPGELSDFTPCFFDPDEADKRITAESREVSIEQPTFTSGGVADLEETFVVQTTGSYFETRTVSMTLNKEGNLTEGKIETKDETLPIAIKAVETGIGLFTKAATLGLAGSEVIGKFIWTEERINFSRLNPVLIEEEILKKKIILEKTESCVVAGIIREQALIENKIKEKEAAGRELVDKKAAVEVAIKSETNADKKKQLEDEIAQREKEIKKNTSEVEKLTGELKELESKRKLAEEFLVNVKNEQLLEKRQLMPFVMLLNKAERTKKKLDDLAEERRQLQINLPNMDKDVYNARLTELDAKIKSLRELFFGKTDPSLPWTGNFEFNPSKNAFGTDQKTLFTYSKTAGICSNAPFNNHLVEEGILVSDEFKTSCNESADLIKVQIFADRLPDNEKFISQVNAAKRAMQNVTSGWYFRIPAKTNIVLRECKRTPGDARCLTDFTEYGREKMMVAQYGTIVSLPAKTAGRSSSSSITLDETTGALKNFAVSSSPLLDKSTIEDAGKTVEKIIDANDPLAEKKRELDLLKTQNEINTERKKLENPSPSPTPSPEQ